MASRHLQLSGGRFVCVFPHEPAQRERVEAAAAAAGSFTPETPGRLPGRDPPLVGLFGMMRRVDLPDWMCGRTWVEPDLIIRDRDGRSIRSIPR